MKLYEIIVEKNTKNGSTLLSFPKSSNVILTNEKVAIATWILLKI